MGASIELEGILKNATPEIQEYVKSLQSENARLVKLIAKTETQLTTANSIIEEYKKGNTPDPLNYMTDEELTEIAKGKK